MEKGMGMDEVKGAKIVVRLGVMHGMDPAPHEVDEYLLTEVVAGDLGYEVAYQAAQSWARRHLTDRVELYLAGPIEVILGVLDGLVSVGFPDHRLTLRRYDAGRKDYVVLHRRVFWLVWQFAETILPLLPKQRERVPWEDASEKINKGLLRRNIPDKKINS